MPGPVGAFTRFRHAAAGAIGSSWPACSPSSCSISPGGSIARMPAAATSFPAASSAWTTSAYSTARSRCRDGAQLEQADGTAWMAFYCATMLSMALELARDDPTYEDIASKFFEHFVDIADAMNCLGGNGLWNEADGFYYDQLMVDGRAHVAASPLDGRHYSALCRRGPRGRGDRQPARVPQADGVVSETPLRPGAPHLLHGNDSATERRTAIACWPFPRASGCERVLRYLLGRERVPLALRDPVAVAHLQGSALRVPALRSGAAGRVPARRVGLRLVRRQLELARPDLVPGQLPADRGPGTLSPFLWRRRCGSSARPAPAGC